MDNNKHQGEISIHDGVLTIVIDFKESPDIISGRVKAYGVLQWGLEVASRYFTVKEMEAAKQAANKGLVRPKAFN